MRIIQLTKGFEALVDDEDYARLSQRKWQANVQGSYVRAMRSTFVNREAKRYYMHHEVLGVISSELKQNGLEVDHIDRNPLNNQKHNLRIVTRHVNMQNTRQALNRVGYSYSKRAGLWLCYLDLPGRKRQYLGYTKTKEDAIVRVEAARHENY